VLQVTEAITQAHKEVVLEVELRVLPVLVTTELTALVLQVVVGVMGQAGLQEEPRKVMVLPVVWMKAVEEVEVTQAQETVVTAVLLLEAEVRATSEVMGLMER
jgi:hypothetical protein